MQNSANSLEASTYNCGPFAWQHFLELVSIFFAFDMTVQDWCYCAGQTRGPGRRKKEKRKGGRGSTHTGSSRQKRERRREEAAAQRAKILPDHGEGETTLTLVVLILLYGCNVWALLAETEKSCAYLCAPPMTGAGQGTTD